MTLAVSQSELGSLCKHVSGYHAQSPANIQAWLTLWLASWLQRTEGKEKLYSLDVKLRKCYVITLKDEVTYRHTET